MLGLLIFQPPTFHFFHIPLAKIGTTETTTAILFVSGAGCSGKTTFLKQLRIVYDNGYTEKERKAFKSIIYENIRRSMVRIVEGMEEIGLAFESDQLITKVCKMDGNGVEM